MATAVMAGLVAYGGAASYGVGTAIAIGVMAAAATAAVEESQKPGSMPDQPAMIDLEGTAIDKESMQSAADLGDLKLGEAADEKAKRKKGKKGFKIDLDAPGDDIAVDAGIQFDSNTDLGVQL